MAEKGGGGLARRESVCIVHFFWRSSKLTFCEALISQHTSTPPMEVKLFDPFCLAIAA